MKVVLGLDLVFVVVGLVATTILDLNHEKETRDGDVDSIH